MKYVNGDGSVISGEQHTVSNGNEIEDTNTVTVVVTPRRLGKSYVYQSDHSLVAVLRRREGEEDLEDDEENSAWSGSDNSEAALTRVHRFCWAVFCCHSSSCCFADEDEVSESTIDDDHDVDHVHVQAGRKRKCSVVSVLGAQLLLLRQKLEFAENG